MTDVAENRTHMALDIRMVAFPMPKSERWPRPMETQFRIGVVSADEGTGDASDKKYYTAICWDQVDQIVRGILDERGFEARSPRGPVFPAD